jgi:hypothetical protein
MEDKFFDLEVRSYAGTRQFAGQTAGIDPLLPFKIGPANELEARESG